MKTVCVFSHKEILKAGLLSSSPAFLKRLDLELVDNTQGQYTSMAEAVRDVIKRQTNDEIMMIVHQDVLFYDPNSYDSILRGISRIDRDVFLAGVVGVKPLDKRVKSYGVNPIISGGRPLPFAEIEGPTPVETIDECVMISNAATIRKMSLLSDAKLGWHLYAVDASLTMARNGYTAYVLPLSVNHLSKGSCTPQYFDLGKYLLRKHNLNVIYTTNGPLTRWNVHTRKLKAILKVHLKLT